MPAAALTTSGTAPGAAASAGSAAIMRCRSTTDSRRYVSRMPCVHRRQNLAWPYPFEFACVVIHREVGLHDPELCTERLHDRQQR